MASILFSFIVPALFFKDAFKIFSFVDIKTDITATLLSYFWGV